MCLSQMLIVCIWLRIDVGRSWMKSKITSKGIHMVLMQKEIHMKIEHASLSENGIQKRWTAWSKSKSLCYV